MGYYSAILMSTPPTIANEEQPRIREFGFTDVLGWSYTRYSTFQSCKRQYFYEKYPKFDLEHNYLKIKSLSQLTSIPLEIGFITHELIKTLLARLKRSSEPIDRERFFDYARREGESIFKSRNFEDIYYGVRERIDDNEQAALLARDLADEPRRTVRVGA